MKVLVLSGNMSKDLPIIEWLRDRGYVKMEEEPLVIYAQPETGKVHAGAMVHEPEAKYGKKGKK